VLIRKIGVENNIKNYNFCTKRFLSRLTTYK